MSKKTEIHEKERYCTGRLQDDEVVELAKRMEAGDREARDLLLMAHIPLAKYLANYYSQRCQGYLYDDLYQEGCVGMLEALNRFDYRRDVPFSTYASFYMIKRFKEYIRNQDLIKLPEEVYYQVQKYFREYFTFIQNNGREPTAAELSEHLSLPVSKVEQLKSYAFTYVALDHPPGKGRGGERVTNETMHNVLLPPGSPFRPVEAEVLVAIGELDLADLDVRLTKRESAVLHRKLGLTPSGVPETFPRIAKQLGLSGECVRLAYHDAVNKIRKAALDKGYTLESFPLS